jgi:hypothetical protein
VRVVLLLVAHELRTRWRGWAVLVLLVALAGGAVLTAAAGARRTSSAYPRFLRASHASGLLIAPAGTGLNGYDLALARLRGVRRIGPVVGLNVEPVGPGGRLNLAAVTEAPLDGRFGRELDIPRILTGRLPRQDRPGEVAVTQLAAASLHVHVGSRLPTEALSDGNLPGSGPAARPARRLTLRVVGVIVTPSSADPVTDSDRAPFILASSALWHRLGAGYRAFDGAELELRPGASAAAVGGEAQALARRFPSTQGQIMPSDEGTEYAAVERSIHPDAVALAIFALVLACTVLLIVTQAAGRLLLEASSGHRVLAALGMTRGQLTAAGLLEVAVATATGAVLAAAVAVAASPLMPVGAARLAEPSPGISTDWLVLTAGPVAIVGLLVGCAAWPAWRLASAWPTAPATAAPLPRQPRIARWLSEAGAPVTVAEGVRRALQPGRGRSAVPVRAALAGTILPVLAVTAAFTFGTNLLALVHTPRLYGQSWDAAVDLQFSFISPAQARRLFGTNPGVTAWTFGDHGVLGINGHLVPAIGLVRGRGRLLSPVLLAGHAPLSRHDIVLGTSTMRRLGLHTGQQVRVTVGGHPTRDRVVGRAVFPNFGQGGYTPTDLGEGAETTGAVLRPATLAYGGASGFEFVLLRFAGGPARQAAVNRFRRSMTGFCSDVEQSTCVVIGQQPNGLTNYAPIDGIPEVLAALLAALGTAVLGQVAVVSGRRRRHEFAVLKALGLLRRQIREISAWQVSILAGLALLIGLPLGLAAGRWSWQLFGTGLGVAADARVPVTLLLVMVPAVLIIANAVALWPGRSAARVSPARALRTE